MHVPKGVYIWAYGIGFRRFRTPSLAIFGVILSLLEATTAKDQLNAEAHIPVSMQDCILIIEWLIISDG